MTVPGRRRWRGSGAAAKRRAAKLYRSARYRDHVRNRERPRVDGHYEVISPYPVVVYCSDHALTAPAPAIFEILDAVARHPIHLLVTPWWHVSERRVRQFEEIQEQLHRRYPGLSLTVAAPTDLDRRRFLTAGLQSLHFNQNALVDERLYTCAERDRDYQAVYTARLAAFKRHHLAADVGRLALVCAADREQLATPYGRLVRRRLRHADWVLQRTGRDLMRADELSDLMSRSGVGLALSAVEGPMYASVEYLLAGLPVVTTPAHGGRHEFFDPAFTLTVDPTPTAVAAGVRQLNAAKVDRKLIRRRTLAKIAEHRLRFLQWVQAIYDRAGVDRSFADEWDGIFYDKLLPWGLVGGDRIAARNERLIAQLTMSEE